MTQRGSRRSALRDRAPSLRAAPEARRWSTPGSTAWSGGRSFRVVSVELLHQTGIQNIFCVDSGPFLRAVTLPIDQVLESASPASGVEKFSHLIYLLVLPRYGQGVRILERLLGSLPGIIGGFQERDMKSGRNAIVIR